MRPGTIAGTPERAKRSAGIAIAAFVFLCLYFTGVFPPWANPNELSRFQAVFAMAEDRTFAIDDAVARLGDHEDKSVSGGHLYSNKAPGLAWAALPVYRALRLVMPAPERGTEGPLFILTRLLTVSLACVVALRRFAARAAEGAPDSAVGLVVLAVALGTPFLFYARSFFSHAWTAALLFLAWDRVRRAEERNGSGRGGRTAALGGLLAGWAAISEYSVAPLALALGVRAIATRSGRRLTGFVLGAVVPLALLAAYDAVCFGSPWTLSSAKEASADYAALAGSGLFGFGLPSPRIAFAYLLDPARGVLLFSPFFLWIFAGLRSWWRRGDARRDWWTVALGLPFFFVCLCGYPNWHGGWSLGSRYLLPGLFFAALPLSRALEGALSRGLFLAATVFAVGAHFVLTAAWPHFPPEMRWPEAAGSLWFVVRRWVAPTLAALFDADPWVCLALPAVVTFWALWAAGRDAAPVTPAAPVAALLGIAPLVALLLRPPEPPYFARLWRAGVYGAFSGRDDARTELRAVALEARTPEERRLAVAMWRWFSPRSTGR
jgi:hypothetical protein